MFFCPVASGSNGNSIYISSGSTHILIDAGLSGVRLESRLKSAGVDIFDIAAVFITHEHSDHVCGAGVLSRRYDIPVYATEGTWQAMERDRQLGRFAPKNRRIIYKEEPMLLNDIAVHPFSIPHDAADPVGYRVFAGGKSAFVGTDIGKITDSVRDNIKDSDIILIEANHDEDMVVKGSYPWPLKKRILGDFGHLSNVNCGKLLSETLDKRVSHIYLGHLSGENNLPQLAYDTVKNILLAGNLPVDEGFKLHVADRTMVGELVRV